MKRGLKELMANQEELKSVEDCLGALEAMASEMIAKRGKLSEMIKACLASIADLKKALQAKK